MCQAQRSDIGYTGTGGRGCSAAEKTAQLHQRMDSRVEEVVLADLARSGHGRTCVCTTREGKSSGRTCMRLSGAKRLQLWSLLCASLFGKETVAVVARVRVSVGHRDCSWNLYAFYLGQRACRCGLPCARRSWAKRLQLWPNTYVSWLSNGD